MARALAMAAGGGLAPVLSAKVTAFGDQVAATCDREFTGT